MVTASNKEKCEGCCKNIFMHNKVVVCSQCNAIAHFKCAQKTYNYDQIKDLWACWKCISNQPQRYNPFDSIFYNKYLIDDHDALEETNLVTSILNNCKSLDLKSINKTNDVASVFFNNIDGVTSNFDRLHTELSTLKNSLVSLH